MLLLYQPIFILLSFAALETLAGQPSHQVPARSRKHHRQLHNDASRNLTNRGAPKAKSSPMHLVDKYEGKGFFDNWDFFAYQDPTNGNVEYVDKNEAMSLGLASVSDDNVVILAVDDKSWVATGGNRKSVRISSRKAYTGGLFVIDLDAMPTGCGTWPAFWTVNGGSWPEKGEIDIIEGVNRQTCNQMTLHTAQGCNLDKSALPAPHHTQAYTGRVLSTTCDARLNSNSGCGVLDSDTASYGAGVQAKGGAVYAMLWDKVGIRIWHFDRSSTPPDLTASAPNPVTWIAPSAFWSTTTCPMDEYFEEHTIIINTSLCGDFAGSAYPSSGCPGTCAERIADPKNFKDAKWKINYVAVYK